MSVTSATARAEVLFSATEAFAVARAYAESIGSGVIQRDRAGTVPYAGLAALDASGLLGITVPAAYGGPDLSPAVLAEVVRTIAAVDPAIAQVPQAHFLFVDVLAVHGSPAQQERLFADVLAGARLGNGLAERGGQHAQDLKTRLRSRGGRQAIGETAAGGAEVPLHRRDLFPLDRRQRAGRRRPPGPGLRRAGRPGRPGRLAERPHARQPRSRRLEVSPCRQLPAQPRPAPEPRAALIMTTTDPRMARGDVRGQELSAADFRHAIGHFATGVTIVTSVGIDGEPVGTTANAVSSLSLDPPLILVCFDRSSQTLRAVLAHGAFAVNVLGARQQDLSANFARGGLAAAWDGVRHRRGQTGSPRLEDVIASLECTVAHRLDGGDHEIIVGQVREAETSGDDAAPLVFWRGSYASLGS